MSVFKLTKMCTSNMCNFLYIMHNSMKSKKYVGAADVLDNKEYREMSRVFSRFSSVAQSCPTLCNPMDCSMPGFPVYQQLLELAQTHVHQVSNAIQPSHPLSSPSPPAFNLSPPGSLPMSLFLTSGGQSIGALASASVLVMTIQDCTVICI